MKKYSLTDNLKRGLKESLESFKKQFKLDKPTLDDFKRISKIPGANVSLGFDPNDPRIADEEANREKLNQDFEELKTNQNEKDKTVPGRTRKKKDTQTDYDATTLADKTQVDAFSSTDVVGHLANDLADKLAKKINAAEPMDQKDLSAAIEAEIKNYLSNR